MYPKNETFVALGIWGTPIDFNNSDGVASLEKEFNDYINNDNELYRYIQTEYIEGFEAFPLYFSKEVRRQFKPIKNQYDPKGLFPNYLEN